MMRWSLIPYAYVLAGSLVGEQVAIAQVTPDTTLGTEASQVNAAIVRGAPADLIEGGAQRGENLFHSFEEFSIGEFQRVYFANPGDINTILSRVTGNQSSEILGTLGVDGPANLFFLNPHGVVFGTNATLDIEGSLVVSTADEFDFGNGIYSAITPDAPPLLTVGLTPGLQYSAAQRSQITSSAELAVGGNLLLDAADIDIAGSLTADRDIVLRAADTAALRDNALRPLWVVSGGNLLVQATDEIVIDALAEPNSMLASHGNLTLRSDGSIIGDGHFQSAGSFQIQQSDGSPGSFLSPNDPIIRSAGDVSFEDYEGASLHILAGGSVTANNITITGADASNGLVETVNLSQALADGTTSVAVNGRQQPTLDVRAGTTNIGTVGIVGTPSPNNLTVANAATSANISIDRINIDETNGLVLLTNQYQPNSALSGDISIRAIDTRDANGGGDVIIDSRNNIDLQTYGAIRTNAVATATGDAGRIALTADGDVTLNERYVVQARGQGNGAGGTIDVVANNLTLENRTQLDTTTRGQKIGGDININVDNAIVLRGTNTRIVNLVETGATADSGEINIQADSLDITNGAGIFSGVRGTGNSGDINLNISGQTLIDGTDAATPEDLSSASNSAIANVVFPGGVGTNGDINLAGGSLILTDGGVITNLLGVEATVPNGQQAGDINLDLEGAILITRTAAPDRLPDSEISAPPVVGKVDVFFLADNTGSMRNIIAAVRSNASDVLNTLSGNGSDTRFNDIDFGFGVGRYLDEPARGLAPELAYTLLSPVGEDTITAEVAINQWTSDLGFGVPGFISPEGNFFALHQVATSGQLTESGVGTGQITEWRDNAERVILWFGDQPSLENTIAQGETIEALISNDVRVAAINTRPVGFGIDEGLQASSIANATGGSIAHNVNTSNVADTILTAVDETLFPDYTNVVTPRLIRNDAYPLAPSGLYLGSDTRSVGQNGGLNIDAEQVTFIDNAQLSNLVSGSGDGGEINIRVDNALTLQENSRFFSINNSEGRGSDIIIRAEDVLIQDRSEATLIRTQSETFTNLTGVGAIGNLDLQVNNQLTVDNRSAIGIVSAGESIGNGGLATIRARDIIVSNNSGITGNSTSEARGSTLDISADNTIRLNNRAQISSDSLDQAIGGDLNLNARLIQLNNVGEITTSALGTGGKGGTITINASDGVESRNLSSIQTLAFQGDSSSGDIVIDTSRLLVNTGSRIEAGTGATGNGGDISINSTDSITVSGFIDVTNRDFREIVSVNPIFAEFLNNAELLDQLASIFPEVGDIRRLIDNPDEVTRIFSGISSVSTVDSTGDGGDIDLSTQQLDLNNQAQIVSQALGTGFAGDIDINVSDRFYVDAGEVSANSDFSGGGNITINAPAPRQGVVFLRNGSLLSTSVFDSTGGGGNINIQAGGAFVAIENSDILANAEFGPGGDIEINTPAFLAGIFASGQATPVGRNPGSFAPFRANDRVDISADSAFGNSGGLDLTNLATDQGATDLPIDLTDPSGLIDRRCSLLARRSDSEFTIEGRGGLPLSPNESTTDLLLLEDLGPDVSSAQSNIQSHDSETTIAVENVRQNYRPPEHIIEPVAWERTADGSIYLRSETTTAPELFDTRCYDSEAT